MPPNAGFQITGAFATKQLTGNAGCNDYNAKYNLFGANGFAIKGEITATSKICGGAADANEAEYLASLVQVSTWKFDDPKKPSKLILASTDQSVKLVYNCNPFECPVP